MIRATCGLMNDRSSQVRGRGGPIRPTAPPTRSQLATRMRANSAAAIVAIEK